MTFTDYKYRSLKKEELQEIRIQDQAGIEFIFWYYDMGDRLSEQKILKGMEVVLDKLYNGLEFPIADYSGSREVATLLGFTLGEMLRNSFNWEWYYFEEFEDGVWGYTIVSPLKDFGICIENLFFQHVFYKKEILFKELSLLLVNGKYPKLKAKFEAYEPWNSDYTPIFNTK